MNENSPEAEAIRLSPSKIGDQQGTAGKAELALSLIVRTLSQSPASC
jgi:hypothetical protein